MPGLDCPGIVQAKDFYIRHEQTRALDCGPYLGHGPNITAWEDVFGEPWVSEPGAIGPAYRMQKKDAVIGKQPGALAKILFVESQAHMLEHPDRDDTVEDIGNVAVVREM